MDFEYKHSLSIEDARNRLKALGEYLCNRHGIQASWVDEDTVKFSGKYMVVEVEGEMRNAPGTVRFQGKDPGFLFRKKAQTYILGKLEKYLNPTTAADSLPR